MKLETFFEKFNQFAEAPNAVTKLRELILQLAVQGKLMPQDPADGDADLLLRDIAEARSAKGRGKQSGVIPEERIAESDQWFEVPPSWCWVRLCTVGDIVGGGTPRSDNATYFAEEGIPWLTPADLNGYKEKRIARGRRCITPLGLANSSAQLLPAGSVLFSSRAPIGYVAIADTELTTNQGFKSCVPFIIETNEFLYYFLKSAAARIDREASGTTFREVSGKIVSQIPVPLPPLAEQKRIVAKVDELMALCDCLEVQQQERDTRHAALARASLARFADAPTPANLNHLFHPSFAIAPADLRKTIRTLAVQGKLVPQDPQDDSAKAQVSQALGKMQADRKEQKVKDDAFSTDLVPFDQPWSIPDSWLWVGLASVCRTITDGEHLTPAYSPDGIPMLSAKHIGVRKLIWEDFKYVSKGVAEKCWSRCKPEIGDILVVSRGGGVGRTIVSDRDGYCLMGSVLLFKTHPNLCSDYLNIFLNSEYGSARLRTTSGSSAQQAIYIVHLRRDYMVASPPLAEQRRIVVKVNQLMALVDQLESQLAASHAAAVNLMETAVAELTAQE